MNQFLLIIVIGIIMPQVNVLPVNVSQHIDSKEGVSAVDTSSSKDGFSQYIDLHLNKNKQVETSNKAEYKDAEAKESNSSIDIHSGSKKSGSAVESSEQTDGQNHQTKDDVEKETTVQKLAASGNKDQKESNNSDSNPLNDSEELMSFLSKVDNTLVNKSADSTTNITPEQKAHYEAELLLKTSGLVADLSPVAKALVNEQRTLVVEPELTAQKRLATEPTSTEQEITAEELVFSKESKIVDKEIKGLNKEATDTIVKSSTTLQSEGKSTDTLSVDTLKSSDKASLLSEHNSEPTQQEKNQSKTEVKLSNISDDKLKSTQQNLSQPSIAADTDVATDNDDENALIADKNLTKQTKVDSAHMSSEKVNQDVGQKEVIQNSKAEAVTPEKSIEGKVANHNAVTPLDNKAISKQGTEKSLENKINNETEQLTSQVAPPSERKSEKPLSASDAQVAKTVVTQSNETVKVNETANDKKIVMDKNQQTSSHENESIKLAQQDEKTKLAEAFSEQNQQKSAAQKEIDTLAADKVPTTGKREPSTTSHFINVSGNATQTPQYVIDQQSVETLNPSVATEVTQSQKTNTQLHQETISIFRKDFNEAVKDKVMLMISQKLQQFDITLDPPELGNMQVRVNLQGEQAVVNFLVQSQQTKDALEQNMNKLREMLAEQGVDVGDANVDHQSQQSSDEENTAAENNNPKEGKLESLVSANDLVAHTLSAQMVDSSSARVDYYA